MKRFNTTAVCIPEKHYMADISDKIKAIAAMVQNEEYFTINRPRQYGKSTILFLLKKYLSKELVVLNLSFESFDFQLFNLNLCL